MKVIPVVAKLPFSLRYTTKMVGKLILMVIQRIISGQTTFCVAFRFLPGKHKIEFKFEQLLLEQPEISHTQFSACILIYWRNAFL